MHLSEALVFMCTESHLWLLFLDRVHCCLHKIADLTSFGFLCSNKPVMWSVVTLTSFL